jgi:hypothetical protein
MPQKGIVNGLKGKTKKAGNWKPSKGGYWPKGNKNMHTNAIVGPCPLFPPFYGLMVSYIRQSPFMASKRIGPNNIMVVAFQKWKGAIKFMANLGIFLSRGLDPTISFPTG